MSAPRSPLARCGLVALALAIATPPAPARAADPPGAAAQPGARSVLAVLPLEVVGELPQHIARALEERLAAGLRHGELTVVSADALRAAPPTGCAGECLRDAALAAGATHLVRTRIVVEGRDYTVEIVLARADTGEHVASSNELCEICGHEELGDRIDDRAAAIRRKASAALTPAPRLRVESRPPGSTVSVDGEVVGVTPLDVAVPPGEHDVVVHRRGFIAERRRLAFVDGVVETLDAELAPAPDEAPRSRPSARRLAPPGWAALAVGIAATAGGVALIALDERPIRSDCAGANIDFEGNCRWRYDTLAGGAALTAAGVAAIALGAILLAVDRRRNKPTRATASGLGLTVRF